MSLMWSLNPAMGVTVMGMLDRAWHTVDRQTVAVDRDEMIAVVAEVIVGMSSPVGPRTAG